MHHDDVAGVATVDHRKNRWIAHEAAVPIILAVDLRRSHLDRVTAGGEHMVCGELLARERFYLGGAYVGGAKKQLNHLLAADALEVDCAIEQISHRIDVERI